MCDPAASGGVAAPDAGPARAGTVLGGAVVLLFPRRDEEKRLLAEYNAEDTSVAPEQAARDCA